MYIDDKELPKVRGPFYTERDPDTGNYVITVNDEYFEQEKYQKFLMSEMALLLECQTITKHIKESLIENVQKYEYSVHEIGDDNFRLYWRGQPMGTFSLMNLVRYMVDNINEQ